jgi:hypothetical protein
MEHMVVIWLKSFKQLPETAFPALKVNNWHSAQHGRLERRETP